MKLKETIFPDHFTRLDRNVVLAAFLFAIVASILLFVVKPASQNKSQKAIAHVDVLLNNVRYKESGSVSFYDAAKNEKLQNGDEVFTGENSSATIRFTNSTTVLKIPSSSLVKIEENEKGESIEIKEGIVDIVVKKDKAINVMVNGVTHQISTPQAESVVKAFSSAGELHLFTKSKGVKIKNATNEKQAEVAINQDVAPIKAIAAALPISSSPTAAIAKSIPESNFLVLSPLSDSKVETSTGIKITTNQKSKYFLSLSKNIDFVSPVFTSKFEGTEMVWNATSDEGDYYLKVENDKTNRIIPISLFTKFKLDSFRPTDGELLTLNYGEKVKLHWNSLASTTYKVNVKYSDGLEKTITSDTNSVSIDFIKGAKFDWTVASKTPNGTYTASSKNNKVEIKYKEKIIFNQTAEKPKFKLHENSLLSWSSFGAEKFLIKISKLKSNTGFLSKESSSPNLTIPTSEVGTYKVDVESIDYPRIDKATFQFDVASSILTWDPKSQKSFSSTEEDTEIPLKFSSPLEIRKNAKFHVRYFGKPGEPTERDFKLSENSNFKTDGFGQYCIKAQLEDPMDYYTDSGEYCFNLIKLAVFKIIPKAKDTILTTTRQDGTLAFKLVIPKISKAAKYHFEVFSDPLGQKLVYSVDSEVPEIYWVTNRSGIYYFRYKCYDIKNRESPNSPISKLIFPISPLSDWKPED
jgi:hypothetical protein